MKNVIGIKLAGYKMNGERTLQVDAKDKKDLYEFWAGSNYFGKPNVWTEEEVKTKISFLKSQVGDFIEHFQGFHIEFMTVGSNVESLYQVEMTVANDGVEA